MAKSAGFFRKLVAKVCGRSSLHYKGKMPTVMLQAEHYECQKTSRLFWLPPELLRLIWQYTDPGECWKHRATCRALYAILSDVTWRDQLPEFLKYKRLTSTDNHLLHRFGHLMRSFSTPDVIEGWPDPVHWPSMFPNLTLFTFDMNTIIMFEQTKLVFEECIAKMPYLCNVEIKVNRWAMFNYDSFGESVINLAKWADPHGALPNLKTVYLDMDVIEESDWQMVLSVVVRAIEPVLNRVNLRIRLRTFLITSTRNESTADVAPIQDLSKYVESLVFTSWLAGECFGLMDEHRKFDSNSSASLFPHLRLLRILVCSCIAGNKSYWNPSTFPSLEKMFLHTYASQCTSPHPDSASPHPLPIAMAIFEHCWPKVYKFEFEGEISACFGFSMTAAFPKCRSAVINRLFAVADSDNANHIDSLARACRHLRRLHIECGILEQMLVKLAINQSPALETRLFPFLNHLYLGQFHITDGTTLACVMSFPSLVFLSLSRCDMDETDQFLDQFNQAMPAGGSAVKSFIMRRRSGFYPASFLIAIAQLCPRLQKYITTYGSPVFLPALQTALPNVDVALF